MVVPERFQPHIRTTYPEHNTLIFEEWFFDQHIDLPLGPEYLPVFFTSFHVNHKYGTMIAARQDLQKFIDSLPNIPMFTILQYDSGPLVKLPANIKVFAMSGPRIDFPIPLICQPHGKLEAQRDIFCNFIGRMTHSIRHKMMRVLRNDKKYHTSQHIVSTLEYCTMMARSVFTLCPRGVGESSFRICEALEQGSIPVYCSDTFIFPGNVDFTEFGVVVKENEVELIDQILTALTPSEILAKQIRGREIYKELYTFEGCRNLILNNL